MSQDERNTYRGAHRTLNGLTECIGGLQLLGFTDITVTSVPHNRLTSNGDEAEHWSYEVEAFQRTPNAAIAEDRARRLRDQQPTNIPCAS